MRKGLFISKDEEIQCYLKGLWVEDEEGNLYIVPCDGSLPEIGPDNDTMGLLLEFLNVWEKTPDEVDEDLLVDLGKLKRIPVALRRYNSTDGYYHA